MVDILTISLSAGVSLLSSLALVEYRLRRQQSVEETAQLEEWYQDSAAYAAETRRIWPRMWDSADLPRNNSSQIGSEMGLLEGQISRHASEGEKLDVDQDVIDALDTLAEECRRPSEHGIHGNSGEHFEEFRRDILDAVEDVEDSLDERSR